MYINSRIFNERQEVKPSLFEDYEHQFSEEFYDLLYILGEQELQEDKTAYDEQEWEEMVRDSGNEIIGVYRIDCDGLLYLALLNWYGSQEIILNSVRSAYIEDNYLYYVTGCGYDTIDSDLLNGNADGKTKDKFLEFINKI